MGSKEAAKLFTCKDCGAHALRVCFEYTVTQHYAKTLACTCGAVADGTAAVYRYHITSPCRDWGWLGERHGVEWEETGGPNKEKNEVMENEEPRLFCQRCVARAAGDEWETKEDSDQPRVDYLSREWWVFCYGCDREIEFGWSLPDRGGRIWPAEYTDFKPLGCWPDPRYVVSWAKKGWSR